MDEKWYVKNTAGKVFGPIELDALKKWVCDGRVEPLAGISTDLKNWMLAPLKAELEMNWIVENNPGQFYGPTHRLVVDDLIKSGTLNAGARFYVDDRGAGASALADRDAALKAMRADMLNKDADLKRVEADAAAKDAELLALRSALKKKEEEVARSADALAAERDAHSKDVEALRVKSDEAAELEKKLGKMTEVHERRWTGEVVEPEVVVSDEPPPATARSAFGSGSLADLERQAQAELAKMGAAGGLRGFFKAKR